MGMPSTGATGPAAGFRDLWNDRPRIDPTPHPLGRKPLRHLARIRSGLGHFVVGRPGPEPTPKGALEGPPVSRPEDRWGSSKGSRGFFVR